MPNPAQLACAATRPAWSDAQWLVSSDYAPHPDFETATGYSPVLKTETEVSNIETGTNTNKPINDWILISGASAISDERDIVPLAIIRAGGEVKRVGIPVGLGNLLLLGSLGRFAVIGIPGCALSPKHNGLDLFLDRLACEMPVSDDWISSLSIGGLLL